MKTTGGRNGPVSIQAEGGTKETKGNPVLTVYMDNKGIKPEWTNSREQKLEAGYTTDCT